MVSRNMTTMTKSRPVKFGAAEDKFLRKLSHDTDLSISDLQRRSVKLLRQQIRIYKSAAFIFTIK